MATLTSRQRVQAILDRMADADDTQSVASADVDDFCEAMTALMTHQPGDTDDYTSSEQEDLALIAIMELLEEAWQKWRYEIEISGSKASAASTAASVTVGTKPSNPIPAPSV